MVEGALSLAVPGAQGSMGKTRVVATSLSTPNLQGSLSSSSRADHSQAVRAPSTAPEASNGNLLSALRPHSERGAIIMMIQCTISMTVGGQPTPRTNSPVPRASQKAGKPPRKTLLQRQSEPRRRARDLSAPLRRTSAQQHKSFCGTASRSLLDAASTPARAHAGSRTHKQRPLSASGSATGRRRDRAEAVCPTERLSTDHFEPGIRVQGEPGVGDACSPRLRAMPGFGKAADHGGAGARARGASEAAPVVKASTARRWTRQER